MWPSCGEMTDDPRTSLAESDQEMVRVIEDLIKVLVDKKVTDAHDLPEAARSKLLRRHLWRRRMKPRGRPSPDDA